MRNSRLVLIEEDGKVFVGVDSLLAAMRETPRLRGNADEVEVAVLRAQVSRLQARLTRDDIQRKLDNEGGHMITIEGQPYSWEYRDQKDTDPPCGVDHGEGPCVLPKGHNMGQADVPEAHQPEPSCEEKRYWIRGGHEGPVRHATVLKSKIFPDRFPGQRVYLCDKHLLEGQKYGEVGYVVTESAPQVAA